jgi:hypothetical protein
MQTATTHAEQNAKAHFDTISALWELHDFLDNPRRDADGFAELSDDARELLAEIADARTFDELGRDDADAVAEYARELALSVCVRSGWVLVGEPLEPEEFELLLSTGGPACRIVGDLRDEEPCRAEVQWQDWGTPWTPLAGQRCDALDWFAGLFYFGAC